MGDGIIPIGQIIKEIQDTGYRGFFEVEIISNKIPPPDYFSLLETIGQSYVETIGAVLQNEI